MSSSANGVSLTTLHAEAQHRGRHRRVCGSEGPAAKRVPVTAAKWTDHLVVPDEATAAQAAEAVAILEQFLDDHEEIRSASLSLAADRGDTEFDIPLRVLRLLAYVLAQTAGGNTVAAAPAKAELTTQQAADLLAVSRPYLVKLLNERQIPFRRVGNRRRLLLSDVMAFKELDESERRSIAAELAAELERANPDGG